MSNNNKLKLIFKYILLLLLMKNWEKYSIEYEMFIMLMLNICFKVGLR